MDFSQYVFSEPYSSWLLKGILHTLIISSTTAILAFLLAVIIHFYAISSRKFFRYTTFVFVQLFRNIPPLPLLLLLVFGLPGLFKSVTGMIFPPDYVYGLLILGLSVNTAAYFSEILKSGYRSLPTNTFDTFRILGIPKSKWFIKIILPQEIYTTFPALTLRFIHNLKNSSLALVIPLEVDQMELMGQTGRIAGQTFAWAEPLIFSVVIYLTLTFITNLFVNYYKKSLDQRFCI